MKKVTLLRSVGIRGKGYASGETLDVDDADAKTLVEMGKAVVVAEPEIATQTPADEPAKSEPKKKARK